MLTSPQPQRRGDRRHRSLRQEYGEFILQRIEEFKQQISRKELLAIADEAVQELERGANDQLVLTEVLMLEHVDRLIMHRLNLPAYRRWRDRHLKLRRAQQQPTHWGLDHDTPLLELARRVDIEGEALVVGARAASAAFFLAAHDWPVVFIDQQLATVEAAETRAAAEALASRFDALVVSLGHWFPDVSPALTVLDPLTVRGLDGGDRDRFLHTATERTVTGGAHYVLPVDSANDVILLEPERVKSHYAGWRVERGERAAGSPWLMAVKG